MPGAPTPGVPQRTRRSDQSTRRLAGRTGIGSRYRAIELARTLAYSFTAAGACGKTVASRSKSRNVAAYDALLFAISAW